MKRALEVDIAAQPTDRSCGAACLHALYRYYRDEVDLNDLLEEVPQLDSTGGTLAVHLGRHALERGYRARIYTYNLTLFDPSWHHGEVDLVHKLIEQARVKADAKLREATDAYIDFLQRGGEIEFQDLDRELLRRHLSAGRPILTGLSSTYLYRSPREVPETDEPDDVRGSPVGHFVVLAGHDVESDEFLVADPYRANPLGEEHHYRVHAERLIAAILLGMITYDANLLILYPPRESQFP